MATKKSILLERLAQNKEKRETKTKAKESLQAPYSEQLISKRNSTVDERNAPSSEHDKSPDLGVIANPSRELAKCVTDTAMVCGWEKAIQEHAYQNRVSEDRIREILNEAIEYDEKADPSGRIEGIEDWKREKQGSSTLIARSARA